MKQVLVIGANSAIAEATQHLWAARGAAFHLVARNAERLSSLASDLTVRGASAVSTAALDLDDLEAHAGLVSDAERRLGRFDVVLVAHGTLGDQAVCERSAAEAIRAFHTNALSTVSLLTHIAQVLERQRSGTLVAISSVAGDRGRQSNYVYGSAKAAVSAFLQGLRNRLSRHGVQVVTIKPGFVDTPMTRHIPEKGLLWAQPEQIARAIDEAVARRRDVVYAPFFWRYIMLVIKAIPERWFKRLSL